jgi:hypothetical protein
LSAGLSCLNDPLQGRVERAPISITEPAEQLSAQVARCGLGCVQPLASMVGEAHRVGATVVRVAPSRVPGGLEGGAMPQGLAVTTAVPPPVNWAVVCIVVLVAEHLVALATPPYGLHVPLLFQLTFGACTPGSPSWSMPATGGR